MKSYGFPTSKAEERILIGPQLCYGVNNQSAVEFPYNQHLKTACNDIISIWCFVNGWKSDFKMITIRYQNFILMADSSNYVVSSHVTVCPSQSSVHRFLGLTSTKHGINVTCSRPQRTAHRPELEPGTPWSEIRRPYHCASPPPLTIY